MKQSVFLYTRDLVWLSWHSFYRSSLCQMIFIIILSWNYYAFHSKGYTWAESIMFAALVALLCMGFGWLVQTLYVLYYTHKTPGTLGRHRYEILDEGFLESTTVNRGLAAWSSLYQIKKTKYYILVYINMAQCHIAPRRDFADEHSYQQFYALLLKHTQANQLK